MVGVSGYSHRGGRGEVSCVHPGMILGWLEYLGNPRLLTQRGGGELCPSRDDPGMVGVSLESQHTRTGRGVSCVHPGMMLGWSEYPGNPRILRQGGKVSCVHPGMILGWSKYPGKSMYRHVGGVFPIPCSSWDHTEDVLLT